MSLSGADDCPFAFFFLPADPLGGSLLSSLFLSLSAEFQFATVSCATSRCLVVTRRPTGQPRPFLAPISFCMRERDDTSDACNLVRFPRCKPRPYLTLAVYLFFYLFLARGRWFGRSVINNYR